MPTMHVIYDPNDRIRHNPDQNRHTGIKVAMLSVHPDMDNDDRRETLKQLIDMLMEQL